MRNTVLIIGAGASRAEATSRKSSLKNRPPLDADFFSLVEQHDLATHSKVVRGFMKSAYGIDIFLHPRPGMEQIFSLVYTGTLSNPSPPGVEKAFSSLCRIYAKVIANTTNWIDPANKGPLYRLIRHAASSGPCNIITFNQDLVIEKALTRLTASKTPINWHLNTGYEMTFSEYSVPSSAAPDTLFPADAAGGASSVTLLKPHGSLNWYVRTKSNDQVLSQFRKSHAINCTRRREINTDMISTTQNPKGRTKWYTWPVIVPPVFEKGTFLGDALSPVWTKAFDAIRSADNVIVYGYSFPETDHQSKSFFMRAVSEMKKSPALVTINPDFNATTRAQAIFKPSLHLWAPDVKSYIKADSATE